MRTRLSGNVSASSVREARLDARLLPGPLTAVEEAAREASLHAPINRTGLRVGRVLVGSAVVAAALTIPDISLEAMEASFKSVNLTEPQPRLSHPEWDAPAGAPAPVLASARKADAISTVLWPRPDRLADVRSDRLEPLGFLDTGSERFDLAFANVAMPSLLSLTLSPSRQATYPGRGDEPISALRQRLIDVPQINSSLVAMQSAPPDPQQSNAALSVSVPGNRALAVSDDAVEAAFAGTLDVSGGVRDALPIRPSAPAPTSDEAVRAVPLPPRSEELSAGILASVELIEKSHLDARINGVLTGRVDFEQQGSTIALRLGSVVDLLHDRYSPAELERISGASALDAFIPIGQLQAAGIPISYNPAYDEVEFGIDYDDAPQADKVQVEQIGTPTLGDQRTSIEQIGP